MRPTWVHGNGERSQGEGGVMVAARLKPLAAPRASSRKPLVTCHLMGANGAASSVEILCSLIGFQGTDEACDHFAYLMNFFNQFRAVTKVAQMLANHNQGLKFLKRTQANVKESRKVGVRVSTMTFGNICWDRDNSPLYLSTKPKSFNFRQRFGELINIWAQLNTLVPNLKVPKRVFSHALYERFYSTFNLMLSLGVLADGLWLEAGGFRG